MRHLYNFTLLLRLICFISLQRCFNMDYQNSRKLLGRFGLAGHAHTIKIKDLSGTYDWLFIEDERLP